MNGDQMTDFEAAANVSAARSNFDSKATMFRWTCTSGVKFALQFWHAKTPIFTYPREWLPWPIEFALGFPRCPYGGVSINIWSNSCALVIALVGELVAYNARYVQEIRSRQPQKVAMEAKKSQ
jgi:tail-anchored protein insertion receptor